MAFSSYIGYNFKNFTKNWDDQFFAKVTKFAIYTPYRYLSAITGYHTGSRKILTS